MKKSKVLYSVAIAAAFAFDASAQEQKRIPIPLQNSRVSFEGDDSFITGRFALQPVFKNHLWQENLTLTDGLIQYGELVPNYNYTQGEFYQESRALVDDWNRQKPIVNRKLSITPDDVKRAGNKQGTYFIAIKGNETGSCGYAKQVAGLRIEAMYGNMRVNVMACSKMPTHEHEIFMTDIMNRMRLDEGEINKAKAAALAALPPASTIAPKSDPQQMKTVKIAVQFTWEGNSTSAATMDFENDRGKGPLSVVLAGRSAPCRGFWSWSRGTYGTAQLPEGTWTLNCPDNLSAGGTYQSTREGEGSGIGTDSNGRKIVFYYRPDASAAKN